MINRPIRFRSLVKNGFDQRLYFRRAVFILDEQQPALVWSVNRITEVSRLFQIDRCLESALIWGDISLA